MGSVFLPVFSTFAVVLGKVICLFFGLCDHSRMTFWATVTQRSLYWVLTVATELLHDFDFFFPSV